MSSIAPSIAIGKPDPFTVVHKPVLTYGSTARVPANLYFSGSQSITGAEAVQLKSALTWAGLTAINSCP